MSRDHHITYNAKAACFNCRKSWRKKIDFKRRGGIGHSVSEESLICPQCGGRMFDIGVDFKAPAQSNVRQWRKVEQLILGGVWFQVRRFTLGKRDMEGPGPRPYSLREVGPFLEERAALIQLVVQQKRKQEKVARRSRQRENRKKRLMERKPVTVKLP